MLWALVALSAVIVAYGLVLLLLLISERERLRAAITNDSDIRDIYDKFVG